jgi:predicted metalloprotease with PDZ domain
MYLQAVQGNDAFLDKLKEYRKAVVAVRETPSDSGSETGPIILGYRTSSTTSKGDASLVIYKKGALVLHMIRNLLIDWKTMNEDKFYSLVKEWYDTHRGRAATTEDFIRLTEKYVGEDMTWFFNQWIYGTEIPTYKFTYSIETATNSTFTATGQVITVGAGPGFRMYVPLEIKIDDKHKAYIRVSVEGPETTFTLPGLPVTPKDLKLNPFESVLAEIRQ